MIRYFLEECSKTFRPNEIKNFKPGDTFCGEGDIYNERIASFDSEEKALEALSKHHSFYREDTYAVHSFDVHEYGVSKVHFSDDDGEEDYNGFDYLAFTPSPFTSEDEDKEDEGEDD